MTDKWQTMLLKIKYKNKIRNHTKSTYENRQINYV